MIVRGKVWCFDDDIDTEIIQPMHAIFRPVAEQVRYAFEATRPGWAAEVTPGDLIVAGRNFGTGSSRPAARVLKDLGIGGLICESINTLFFRNCVNFALPALECPGVREAFTEGDVAEIDVAAGTVQHPATGAVLQGRAWAPELLAILDAGGLIEQLRRDDLLVTP